MSYSIEVVSWHLQSSYCCKEFLLKQQVFKQWNALVPFLICLLSTMSVFCYIAQPFSDQLSTSLWQCLLWMIHFRSRHFIVTPSLSSILSLLNSYCVVSVAWYTPLHSFPPWSSTAWGFPCYVTNLSRTSCDAWLCKFEFTVPFFAVECIYCMTYGPHRQTHTVMANTLYICMGSCSHLYQ